MNDGPTDERQSWWAKLPALMGFRESSGGSPLNMLRRRRRSGRLTVDRASKPAPIIGGPSDRLLDGAVKSPHLAINRTPLEYNPVSTARVNHARLPPPDRYEDMQLAFREQHLGESAMLTAAHVQLVIAFAGALLLTLAVVFIGQSLPIKYAFYAAPGVSFGAVFLLGVSRRLTVVRAIAAIVIPPVAFAAIYAASFILLKRTFGAALTAVIAYAVIAAMAERPIRFYRGWLLAHPRLTFATRCQYYEIDPPDRALLLGVLAIAVLVPIFSTGLAILLILVVCALSFKTPSSFHRVRATAVHAIGQYVTYGQNTSLAPGVWIPEESDRSRRKTFRAIVGSLCVALAIGLTMFGLHRELAFLGPEGYQPWSLFSWRNITVSPAGWMMTAYWLARDFGGYGGLWLYPIALVFACLVPPFVLLAVFRAPLLSLASLHEQTEGYDILTRTPTPCLDDDGRTEWQWYVDRLRDSPHKANDPLGWPIREAEHLFLGVEPQARFPVLLHKPLLSEHAYVVGDSGSGKTSLGLMPMLMQIMRGNVHHKNEYTPPAPMLVIDLKGDPALFNLVRREAEARGQEFRFFTTERGKASHHFNPFDSFTTKSRSPIELCNLMLDALGLNHGEGYGRGYYSRQSRSLLLDALNHESKPKSFEELYAALRELRAASDVYQDTVELISTVHALTQYPMLAVKRNLKHPEQAIHMPSAIERRQAVYFWLPAAVESVSAREVAKLALYCMLSACIDRQRSNPAEPVRQVYLVIDEFQRIAAENFKVILEQARSFGLSMTLANQSVTDLHTPSFDLRPTVRTNTRIKRYFSVTDPREVRELSDTSGLEVMYMSTHTSSSSGHSAESVRDMLKPRFTTNDILAASDHPLDSILHVSRGSGYTQFAGLPIMVRSGWPLSQEDYTKLQRQPWPEVSQFPEEVVVVSDKSPADIDRERDREMGEKALAMMQALLASKA